MVFLDANPVIYLIEQPANLGSKVTARVSDLLASGERLAVSDLVRMEQKRERSRNRDAPSY